MLVFMELSKKIVFCFMHFFLTACVVGPMESGKILNSQMRFASSALLWVLETLESECELRHKNDCESFRNSSLISHGALRNLVTMKINFAPRKTAENIRAEVWSLAEKIISEERQKSLNSASRSNRERKFVQERKSISCRFFICSPTQHHHRRARFTGREKRKSLRLFHPHHRGLSGCSGFSGGWWDTTRKWEQ